jgi:hypothetical protein
VGSGEVSSLELLLAALDDASSRVVLELSPFVVVGSPTLSSVALAMPVHKPESPAESSP